MSGGSDGGRSPRKVPAILFLSPAWPHGNRFGGQMRALHTARALKEVGRLTVVVAGSDAQDLQAQSKTAEEFEVMPPIQAEVTTGRGLAGKLARIVNPRHLNSHGCSASAADRQRMMALCSRFDLVWLLNSRTPNILEIHGWPHSHLDIDDVPSTYAASVIRNETRLRTRWKARVQCFAMKRREQLLQRRFTTLSVCSEADRRYLGGGDRIHVIPNGFEKPVVTPRPAPLMEPPQIGFIGLCSYEPNREGVRWFLRECWPLIRSEVPGIRFRLVGRGAREALPSLESVEAVDELGNLEDAAGEIANWTAMVIPIRVGAGTRIKVADAFSRKCPVVSTSLGAFGYDVCHGRELLLADDPADFARACVGLVRDPAGARAMADRAHAAFLQKWTWEAIAPKIHAAAEDCLRRSAQVQSG